MTFKKETQCTASLLHLKHRPFDVASSVRMTRWSVVQQLLFDGSLHLVPKAFFFIIIINLQVHVGESASAPPDNGPQDHRGLLKI